jgi:hypothetical protein
MSDERIDLIARAALGIGVGAVVAALLADPQTALGASFGLSGVQQIASEVAVTALAIWFVCRLVRIRRGP